MQIQLLSLNLNIQKLKTLRHNRHRRKSKDRKTERQKDRKTEQVKNKNKLDSKIDRHKRKYIRQKDRKTK